MANSLSGSSQLQEMGFFLIKSLDGARKQIVQITPSADGGIVHYKNGEQAPIKVSSTLKSELFCNGYVVVKNIRENVQFVIEHWQEALTFEKLVFLFLDEKTGNKWLLRPHIHAKVAEPKTLSAGLMTLFEHSMGKN